MRGFTLLAVVLAAGPQPGKPATLIARTTKVDLFVPAQRETWTLQLDEAGHAKLDRVLEDVELPRRPKFKGKPRLEEAAKFAEEIANELKWKPSLNEKYEGTATRQGERLVVKAGTVKLDCTVKKTNVRVAGSRLGLPPHPKGCGEITLVWVEPAAIKNVEVWRCSLQGGDDSLDSQLTFSEAPGVDHVIEEDDCAGGDGMRQVGQ